MFTWIKNLINKIKTEIAYRKRLKELKKKDHLLQIKNGFTEN